MDSNFTLLPFSTHIAFTDLDQHCPTVWQVKKMPCVKSIFKNTGLQTHISHVLSWQNPNWKCTVECLPTFKSCEKIKFTTAFLLPVFTSQADMAPSHNLKGFPMLYTHAAKCREAKYLLLRQVPPAHDAGASDIKRKEAISCVFKCVYIL